MRRYQIMAIAAAVALGAAAPSLGADLTIGLAAPLSGATAALGEQMRAGATAAAAGYREGTLDLEIADDECSAEGGASAARAFVAAEVDIVVGFLCTEAIEAAMPILSPLGIAVVTPGVRTESITDRRDRTGWLVYRLAPRAGDEREAVAEILTDRWRAELFAIVDDGTIYGRELAESFRLAAELDGLSPVFVDTFRPQLDNQIGLVGRLRRAGATHVFVGGDREDIAVIARDAAGLDYALTIAGGEALRSAPGETPLAAGTLMIGPPRWVDLATPEVRAYLAAGGVPPAGYALPTYAAVEVAATAVVEAGTSATGPAGVLLTRAFETAIGTVDFDERGDLTRNLYRLFRYDGDEFLPVE